MIVALIILSFVFGFVTFPVGNFIVSKSYSISDNAIWKIACVSFAYLFGMIAMAIVIMIVGIHSPKFMFAFLAGAVFFRAAEYVSQSMRK
jgi:hypothetical protein